MCLHIASITHQPLPSNDAATVQIVHTAAAMVRAGTRLDLFLPRRPGKRQRPEDLRRAVEGHYNVECGFGLRTLPTNLRPWRRTTQAAHAAAAGAVTAFHRYDVLHTRDLPNVLLGLTAGHRVLFESYRTPGGQPAVARVLLRLAFSRPNFLGQITHSQYAREQYVSEGYPSEKLETVYNGFDPGAFDGARSPADARRLLGLPERPTVVYAGRIAPMKRIDLLLGAAARTPEIQWVFAGDAQSDEARPYRLEGTGLANVTFLGYRAGATLAPALEAGDVLVIPPSTDPLTRFRTTVLPLKVFQYLAAGRAIVAGDLPDTAELLVDDANCVRIAPDDIGGLVAAVRGLVADPLRRERLAGAARTLSRGLTWDARAARILAYLRERLGTLDRQEQR
jgi:glycosyltransferase involved in cell wall biosynthesis